MASGIEINNKVLTMYQQIVQRKAACMILKVSDDSTELIIDKSFDSFSDDLEASWKTVTQSLPETEHRFVLCDFQWKVSAAATSSKLIVIHWAPDDAPTKSRMLYATTLESLREKCADTQRKIQATELSEVSYADIKKEVAK